MKKFFKTLLFTALIFVLIGVSSLTLFISLTKNASFNDSLLKKQGVEMEIYDKNDVLVYETSYLGNSYENNIPQKIKNCFIAIEDKRFYSHKGLDYKRMLSALFYNLKSRSYKQGGSTISQQLIKNTHLTFKKTVKRKLEEIKLTKILEKKYTKDEIITMYLNSIYFGENCYGIKNACKKYFNKNVNEISLNEGAMLAGIIKAPSLYNPIANYDLSIKRKNVVLHCMSNLGYISKNEEEILKNEKISISENNDELYFYLCKREVDEILNKYYYDKKIKVYTYLDSDLQNEISSIKKEYSSDYAYVVADNATMGINAFSSSCYPLKRCPASTVKPLLVYAPCLEENLITLQSKILDEPTSFGSYHPKNYNDVYYGYISAKDCLSKSLNIPAIKLLNAIGTKKAKEYANKMDMGIKNEHLALALGSFDDGLTLSQLISCYGTFPNQGNYKKAKFVRKIVSNNGQKIYENKTYEKKIFSKDTAYLINYALMDAVKSGTSKKIGTKNYQLCAKTGTNGNKNGNLDAYSISYTTKHTVGIWLGNKNNSLMDNFVTGSSYPTKINSKILDFLYRNYLPEDFEIPENIVTVKIDKASYDKNSEMLLANENSPFIEGVFKKGTEPNKKSQRILPNIKDYKIYCNNCNFTMFYDLQNCDGIYLYIQKNKNKLYKTITGNNFSLNLPEGKYNFVIVPFKKDGNKIIKGKEIPLPEIIAKKDYNEIKNKEWWNE